MTKSTNRILSLSILKRAIRAFRGSNNAQKYDSHTLWDPLLSTNDDVLSYDAITWTPDGIIRCIISWGSQVYWDSWDIDPVDGTLKYTGQLDNDRVPPGWVLDVARAVRGNS